MDLIPFTYKDLGIILPTANARAKRYIFSANENGLKVTVPPHSDKDDLVRVLDKMYDRLKDLKKRHEETHKGFQKRIGWDFKIENPMLRLGIAKGKPGSVCINRRNPVISPEGRISVPGEICILCPEDINFSSSAVQEILTKGIEDILKNMFKDYLVRKTLEEATRLGVRISGCKVSKANHRWGSCTTRKVINISAYVSLLPEELQEYIIAHELMHTFEMNHSDRFHRLVDAAMGGQEKSLDMQLRQYHPNILSFGIQAEK